MAILVCQCGTRLNAPGAVPGRVGRCPSCGARLVVPDHPSPPPPAPRTQSETPPAAPPPDRPSAPEPQPQETEPTAAGYRIADDPLARPTTLVPPRRRRSKKAPPERPPETGPVGRGGIVRLPKAPETTFRGSLLYPFWDAAGLFALTVVPLVLCPFLLATVGLSLVIARGGIFVMGVLSLLAIATSGMLGYLFLFFNRVITTTAEGEVVHPRWPEVDMGEILLHGLGRWLAAVAVGFFLFGAPVLIVWRNVDRVTPAVIMLLSALSLPAFCYASIGLLNLVVLGDWTALNPWSVLRTAYILGRPSLVLFSLVVLIIMVTMTGSVLLYHVSSPLPIIVGAWLLCVLDIAMLLILMRRLGLAYRRRSTSLGWFRQTTQWGVRG